MNSNWRTARAGRKILSGFRDECAVVGIWGDPEAAEQAYLGLFAQQHRGQESSGIVTLNQGKQQFHRDMGLVSEVFQEETLKRIKGWASIGHNRYSTTGESLNTNIQPLTASLREGPLAVAHNGNIVNGHLLRKELQDEGAIFQGTTDTECLLHLLARSKTKGLIEGLRENLPRLEGAFSLVLLSQNALIAARDPYGFRPLVLGERVTKEGKKSLVLASETCAFDLMGARLVREIQPGEIFWVDEDGEHSNMFANPKTTAHCVFEHVYFARPDSEVFGLSVYEARKRMGQILALEAPVEADMVIPVPDSGVPASLGYSRASGIPFELGIIRNHYVGRTFIEPSQTTRSLGVKLKLNPQWQLIKDKKVVVIDDSLVRGTTSQKIIRLVRQAGAKEVHFRIASPPTTGPCFYGVDTPKKDQLIASHLDIEGIRSYIDADSLAYLSIEGMLRAVSERKQTFCDACFSGNYPTTIYSE